MSGRRDDFRHGLILLTLVDPPERNPLDTENGRSLRVGALLFSRWTSLITISDQVTHCYPPVQRSSPSRGLLAFLASPSLWVLTPGGHGGKLGR